MKIVLIIALLSSVSFASKINVNMAPADSLAATLPGVGPAIAERIVIARPFSTCKDLSETVKGIGEKKIAKICPLISF